MQNPIINPIIKPITIEHLNQYGAIYAAAFSGEPWNDASDYAREGVLPTFYERFGFKKEDRVMLMGKE